MSKPKLKNRSSAAAAQQAKGVSKTVMDSAQQIWLAGLGAFVKAQAEGGKPASVRFSTFGLASALSSLTRSCAQPSPGGTALVPRQSP